MIGIDDSGSSSPARFGAIELHRDSPTLPHQVMIGLETRASDNKVWPVHRILDLRRRARIEMAESAAETVDGLRYPSAEWR